MSNKTDFLLLMFTHQIPVDNWIVIHDPGRLVFDTISSMETIAS